MVRYPRVRFLHAMYYPGYDLTEDYRVDIRQDSGVG